MLGALSVVSMAAYRYGPAPEELAETIDQVASLVVKDEPAAGIACASTEPASSADMVTTATPFLAISEPVTASVASSGADDFKASVRFDPQIQQASATVPVELNPSRNVDDLESERLTAPLLAAGATRAEVNSWGRGDKVVYRATASAPVGLGQSQLEQRFDALGRTPEEAVSALVAELRSAR